MLLKISVRMKIIVLEIEEDIVLFFGWFVFGSCDGGIARYFSRRAIP